MPNFRGQDKDTSGQLAPTGRSKWLSRMHQFARQKRDTAKKKPTVDTLQQARLANKYHVKAFDNALALGAGLDLKQFCVEKPPCKLAAHETRFCVEVASCPAGVRGASADRKLRSCIQDKQAGTTRLEVKWGPARYTIHCNLDEGGDNFTNKFWLFLKKQVRGWLWIDPTHRRHNNWTSACSDASAGWVLKDMALICSIGSAPWGSAGHFGKYSDAAIEYTENFDHSDPLWQLVYPLVAFLFYKGNLPFDWQGDECCKGLWSHLRENKTIAFKGSKAKLGRWFQATNRWRNMQENFGFLAVAILYIGITMKWYADLESSPFGPGAQPTMQAPHKGKQ
jgi:hypothetical protein